MCLGVFVVKTSKINFFVPSCLRGKGFTLIEMVVAIALLVMVVVFAGTIFKVSIGSHRAAAANAEIMQKFRALTAQLDSDFSGLQKDAPLLIWFQLDPCDPNHRFDQILFFADGDFQSTQPYDVNLSSGFIEPAPTGVPVIGNLARIYYSQAALYSPSLDYFVFPWQQTGQTQKDKILNIRNRTLARRLHILIWEPPSAPPPLIFPFPSQADFALTFNPLPNNIFEHDRLALAEWKVIAQDQLNTDQIITTCFGYRPPIRLEPAELVPTVPSTRTGRHMLFSQGVSSFSVQFGYRYTAVVPAPIDEYLWYPSIDPDGNRNFADSDFATMVFAKGLFTPAFGVCFNMAGPTLPQLTATWFPPGALVSTYPPGEPVLFPQTLKFTFTLYDSKKILDHGRTFTHIVYLDD